LGESAKRFPPEKKTKPKGERDGLRNPCCRSLSTRRVSLVTQVLGVALDCVLTCLAALGYIHGPEKSSAPLEEGPGWDNKLREGLVRLRVGLDKGGEDLGMLSEVTQESITAPAAHDLHRLDWHAMK
jgi:hypothetical protein